MLRFGWLLGWLLCQSAWAGVPELPRFRQVGVADGLPASGVNALAVDRAGYLWIATRDGLARYDGVDYRIYRHAEGDPGSLPGNSITALLADDRDRIWVGVEGQGLCRLDEHRRAFKCFSQASDRLLRSNDIWALEKTPDGAVWAGSFGGGLYRFDRDGREHRFLPEAGNPRSLASENVLALAAAPDGSLWIGTTGGLVHFNGRQFEPVPLAGETAAVVLSLSAESDGRLWIGARTGLWQRDPSGQVEAPAWRTSLPDQVVMSVLRDREGTRWIATRRGLVRERDGALDPLAGEVVGRAPIMAGLEDREGGLWFASADRGLFRLPAGWRNFSVLAAPTDDRPARAPWSMASGRDGRVWLAGQDSRVARFDPATGRLETLLADPARLPEGRLSSVLERSDGSVWIGHQDGACRFAPTTKALHCWTSGSAELLPGPVNQLVESGDGLLWLASYGGGVQAFDRDGHVVQRITVADGKGLDSPDQEQLAIGSEGSLWLAGPKGLRRWSMEKSRFEHIPGAPEDGVFGFAVVPPDTVWLHRLGALEAYRWDGQALSLLRRVGADQGLPAAESGGVQVDRSGVVWVTSARGLVRYDSIGDRLRVFGVRDGLPSQEFEWRAPLFTASGIGLASTQAGLLLFDPARIRSSGPAPRLVLDAVSLRRGEDQVELDAAASGYTLGPEDRDLRVVARLLSFSDPAAHRYRFWLHGYDPDWVEVGAQGERVFSRLEPGRYRLQVRAANADGRWSAPRSFDLQVQAPWWRTGWARAGYAVLALLLLLLVFWAYRRRLRLRHARQLRDQRQRMVEESSEAKSRFLATLGHEIRTPMTGVLGMSELLLAGELAPRQRAQVDSIQRAGQHLLRLVNDALDLARIEAGKLSLLDETFDLHAMLDEVANLLRPLAEAKGLAFLVQRAPGTPRGLRGDPGRVRQILLNLGNNAIKFTERGEVALRSADTPNGVVVEVSDTGPGMNADQQARLFQRFEQAEGARTALRYGGSGLGLAISQELAAAMGGRIAVHSQPGQGSTFRVFLPLPTVAWVERAPGVDRGANASLRRRVLLVEDDATVAEVVVGLLIALGHEAVHAPQGLAALSELSLGRFDLALLDLDLPGLDGFELARLIRAQGHRLPLIALTARADGDAEPLARAAGMDGFLRKPVTGQVLADALQAFV
jgi:signal transduction histidine kinase/CheY-like chemotaxis protein/streptogramin lyase